MKVTLLFSFGLLFWAVIGVCHLRFVLNNAAVVFQDWFVFTLGPAGSVDFLTMITFEMPGEKCVTRRVEFLVNDQHLSKMKCIILEVCIISM